MRVSKYVNVFDPTHPHSVR